MRVVTRTAAALATVLVVASSCSRSRATSPGEASEVTPRIRLNLPREGVARGTIDLVGLPSRELSSLQRQTPTPEQWTALLRVSVANEGDGEDGAERLPMLGAYAVSDGAIRFTPLFPLDPGRRYHVVFDPSRLPRSAGTRQDAWQARRVEMTISEPAPEAHATTRVLGTYPTAEEVPENQLRLYIHFSAPMGLKGGVDRVRLLDEAGRVVEDPFLPLDVGLWNADRTRYTVLFDPGRVKRGILPNKRMGRSLSRGRTYVLVVDQEWRDARGLPLAGPFRRQFRVGPPDERPIDPAAWRLEAPPAGTRDPLIVSFPKPLDHALLLRALGVSTVRGQPLDGEVGVEAAETRWTFTPRASWGAGEYRLVVGSVLEDLAGNRIGRAFELDPSEARPGSAEQQGIVLPFRVTLPALNSQSSLVK